MELCVLGKPTVLFPGTTNQNQSSGGRVCGGPGSADTALSSAVSGPGRVAAPAVVPQPPRPQQVGPGRLAGHFAGPAPRGFSRTLRDASVRLLLFAGTDFLLLMLKRAAFAPLTRTLQLCKAMYGNSEEEARGHSSQDRPGRQVPDALPGSPAKAHTEGWEEALGEQVDPGGSREPRSARARQKGRVGARLRAGNAKRPVLPAGRRPRPRRLP